MSSVIISPSTLNGSITLPPSKSYAHRAVICASLAPGKSVVSPIELSDDIKATISACRALGAEISISGNTLYIDGSNIGNTCETVIDCFESGSTLRFMIPIAAALSSKITFTGRGRLPIRPMDIYTDMLPKHGVRCHSESGLPLSIEGSLTSGEYDVAGNVSSQFITGLLFSLPICDGDSKIILTSPLQSIDYVKMTISVLSEFGIIISETDYGYFIKGNQSYKAHDYTVEGDWSQAAFFMAAGIINSEIQINGLNQNSVQGDRRALDIFKKFGGNVNFENGALICKKSVLRPTEIDAENIPDLVPVLAVTAAYCQGSTHIYNASRLRLKESDRIVSTSGNLKLMGCSVKEQPDGMIINGSGILKAATLSGYNDHRIVMAFSIAALSAHGEVKISDAQSINKSYPDFFNDYNSLGGKANVIDLRK